MARGRFAETGRSFGEQSGSFGGRIGFAQSQGRLRGLVQGPDIGGKVGVVDGSFRTPAILTAPIWS